MRFLLILVPLLFIGCEGLKHQQEVDRELEDVGVAAAKEAVKSLDEDNQDREAARKEHLAPSK